MDSQKFHEAHRKLKALDDRLTYKIRPRRGASMHRLGTEQLEERYRELAEYGVGLKEVLDELFQAIAGPSSAQPTDR